MGEDKHRIQTVIISVIDIVAILLSFGIVTFIRTGHIWDFGIMGSRFSVLLFIVFSYIMISFFRNAKKDFFKRGLYAEMVDVVKGLSWLVGVGIIALFCMKRSTDFSRLVVGYGYVLSICLVYAFRCLYKKYLVSVYKKSLSSKRLVIVTLSDKADEILKRLPKRRMWEYKLKGFIFLDVEDSMIGKEYKGIPIMGNYASMFDCVAQRVVDEIFIHVPYSGGRHVAKAVETYESMGITVNLNIPVYDIKLDYREKELRSLGDYYVMTFRQSVIPLRMMLIKRCMDVVGAIVGLILTGIITIILAPILKAESPGPLSKTYV